ncbi:MAG TPA: hypothetical protein ENI23_17430 [bacterium]|nr:hypothetical protein [bacterium]
MSQVGYEVIVVYGSARPGVCSDTAGPCFVKSFPTKEVLLKMAEGVASRGWSTAWYCEMLRKAAEAIGERDPTTLKCGRTGYKVKVEVPGFAGRTEVEVVTVSFYIRPMKWIDEIQ